MGWKKKVRKTGKKVIKGGKKAAKVGKKVVETGIEVTKIAAPVLTAMGKLEALPEESDDQWSP